MKPPILVSKQFPPWFFNWTFWKKTSRTPGRIGSVNARAPVKVQVRGGPSGPRAWGCHVTFQDHVVCARLKCRAMRVPELSGPSASHLLVSSACHRGPGLVGLLFELLGSADLCSMAAFTDAPAVPGEEAERGLLPHTLAKPQRLRPRDVREPSVSPNGCLALPAVVPCVGPGG